MKIAMVAPVDEAVPPIKYGGIEIVVANLVEELIRQGHDVTLFAPGKSKTDAPLVELFPEPTRELEIARNDQMREALRMIAIGKVLDYLGKNEFDIVHNHTDWRLLAFDQLIKPPVVTTLHGSFMSYFQSNIYLLNKTKNFVSISLNQRKPLPQLNFVGNVYNGIRDEDFEFQPEPQTQDPYFVFLARMSPEKGPVQAIEIAKRAGVKLIMATKIDPVDQSFYDKEVAPHIDGKQITHVGEIGPKEKSTLLGNARALIAPIQWEEPFGLFFVEAMMCGTPVITMRRGSTSELIIDGKTGFICDSVDEAAGKIAQVDTLDRKLCYEHARENFSAKKMTERYLEVYEQIMNKHKK